MNGSSVFLFTVSEIPKNINSLLDLKKLNKNDINMYFFHQASKLIIDNLVEKLNLDKNKAFCNYTYKGNTVSSTIPIALKDANSQKIIKKMIYYYCLVLE